MLFKIRKKDLKICKFSHILKRISVELLKIKTAQKCCKCNQKCLNLTKNDEKKFDILPFCVYNKGMESRNLEDFSIFELREMARGLGVFNPTVLKKSDLIKAIEDIQEGRVKPYVAKTKQGRPPKGIKGYNKLAGVFIPDNLLDSPTKEESIYCRDDSDVISFHQNPPPPTEFDNGCHYKGFLYILENGHGYLREKTFDEDKTQIVYVPITTINSYNLRDGDQIMCKAYITQKENPMHIGPILEINDVPLLKHNINREKFEDIKHSYEKKVIKFPIKKNNKEIELRKGDTIFCRNDDSLDFKYFITKFITEAKEEFDNIIYLCPMMKPADYQLLQGISAELQCVDFEDNYSVQRRTALMTINRCKRLAEMGKDVCLIVDDIMSLVALDNTSCGELPLTKHIVSSAKNMQKGSITILCNQPRITQKSIENLIGTTFSVIETVGLKLNGRDIDIENSYRK